MSGKQIGGNGRSLRKELTAEQYRGQCSAQTNNPTTRCESLQIDVLLVNDWEGPFRLRITRR